MLKRVLTTTAIGFMISMAVGDIIAFLSSLGSSEIGFVAPQLVDALGSEVAAVILQTFLSGFIGAAGFGGMYFYEIESWSMIKTMAVHFTFISAVFIPIALVLRWMNTVTEILIMEGAMLAVYMVIWLIMCAVYRSQVKDLNELQGEMLRNETSPQKIDQKNGGVMNEN